MQIQSPRFNEMLRRLMAMKVAAPAPELATDIVPIIETEPYEIEHYFLAGVRACVGGGRFTALAANN
ncbi:MAG: hypothetical protein ACYSUI_25320, partial [Planctomycetota bacterium]